MFRLERAGGDHSQHQIFLKRERSRIYAKVYLEHTPFRLNSVSDIPIGENLYVLSAALAGFEKLFAIMGYFKTSEDLVGIDTEGRVKVWFNHNFSRGYHFGNGGRQ